MAEHALRELEKCFAQQEREQLSSLPAEQRHRMRNDSMALMKKLNGSVLPRFEGGCLVLQGTVPTQFRGATYHTPLRLEFDAYPMRPPLVRVTPTDTMAPQTAATQYEMDTTGVVRTPGSRQWDHRTHNATTLVDELQLLFSREPPLYAVPPGHQANALAQSGRRQAQSQSRSGAAAAGAGQQQQQQNARTMQQMPRVDPQAARLVEDAMRRDVVPHNRRGATGGYADIPRTCRDAAETICKFPALRPVGRPAREASDQRELVLEGTVPVGYRGNTYNIPVAVAFPFAYPARQNGVPECRVTPTQAMCLKPNHQHVQSTGIVTMSLLQQWQPTTSRAVLAVQRMVSIFEEETPVFARPAAGSTPAGSGAAAAGRRAGGASPGSSLPNIRPGAAAVQANPSSLLQKLQQAGPPSTTPTEDSERACVVCMENLKSTVLLPCKHLCICAACVRDLVKTEPKCPMCRAHIEDVIDVFT